MKKIIEMDNNNNKNLEIKGTNNYPCQDKKKEVIGRNKMLFIFFKSFIYGQIGIYIYYIVKYYKSYNTFSFNCSFKNVDV